LRHEAYPHPNKWIKFLDRFLIVVAVVGPLMAIPQVFQIFAYKDATGVSALSFSLFTLFDVPWIFYGLIHKDKPIIFAYSLWFIINAVIVVGAVLY
jgi:uncharacterized protein with PQ loop repeat